ncbi:MAG: primosomal protein N', partial [Clostridiales bacterium]|nr:primosomal protein N' [Clostridiales bacterium]
GLSDGERFDEWKRLYRGEAKIAVGARSAIFAPLSDLGLIVIDEEHDSSYISDSNPRYDTKDIAFKRAEMCGASVVLGSATPSIETYRSALTGGLTLIELIDRISSCLTPEVEIIDMTKEIRMGNSGIFSVALKEALEQTIERGEQAMIFINRRGFSSFIMCAECGYTPMCSDCDVSLTYHRDVNRLKCHYCGKNYTVPQKCPKCGGTKLRHGRTGTEKVVLEIEKLFPKAKVIRMDNDTTARKGSVVKILEAFGKGEYNVLVGTQMIAKGHDFPLVTLVGILDADFSLYFDDYRSAERTFQLVTQVAGRAGRADRPGRVLLQTYAPRSYVFYFASKNDYRGFYLKEANTREVTKFPPFSKIVRVLCSSEDEKEAFEATKRIYLEIKNLEKDGGFIYLNAMKSPVNRIKNKVRYQVLMRLSPERADEIIKKVYDITNNNHGKASCFVELNPQSLF